MQTTTVPSVEPPWPEENIYASGGGTSLVFDKSALESLNIHEAALLDHFYRCTITPLFYVECLADIEKSMRSKSTPEQLVGSLAIRTPEWNSAANVHHMNVLKGELSRSFDIRKVICRPAVPGGELLQLGDQKGMVFRPAPEEEALSRWAEGDFLNVERQFAKRWRNQLNAVDLSAMSKKVLASIGGNWRQPKSLEEAKRMADLIIDYMDSEWLIRFGLDLLGVPEATEFVIGDWTCRRRPQIREYLPYFTFMLSINLFFCLVLPTQLLRNVKPSHQIDLAYLYYLPFCAIFTSRDNFHVQIVPLFLSSEQTFVHGDELKADLKNLNELYSALPDELRRTGLNGFARCPPDDATFLVTRMWDKYMPGWRTTPPPENVDDPNYDHKSIVGALKELTESPDVVPHSETDIDKLSYVKLERKIRLRKGKWGKFSEETEARIRNSPE
jgi:hypothetical protein